MIIFQAVGTWAMVKPKYFVTPFFRCFKEGGAILLYLAEKYQRFIPSEARCIPFSEMINIDVECRSQFASLAKPRISWGLVFFRQKNCEMLNEFRMMLNSNQSRTPTIWCFNQRSEWKLTAGNAASACSGSFGKLEGKGPLDRDRSRW